MTYNRCKGVNMNKPCIDDYNSIIKIIPPDRVSYGREISPDYFHDEMDGVNAAPDIVARPVTTEEVSALLAYANRRLLPVIPRGAGTGLVGGAVATSGGILIDLSLMNKIIECDPNNMTVTVQAGVLLMELSAYCEKRGLFYPPDPGEKSATIGGNINTNAGGMRAVKYGVTRNYVMGLTCVLADGAVERVGGKAAKNSSGYSLKDLIVGSEGTLAVVTEAILKVLPKQAEDISMLAPFNDMKEAIACVPKLILSSANPTAIEFITRNSIDLTEKYLGRRFPRLPSDYALLILFDGQGEDEVKKSFDAAAELCLESGAADVLILDTDERKSAAWTSRGAYLEAFKFSTDELDECDIVVPRDKIVEFTDALYTMGERYGLRVPYFGHAGDGNLHIYFCRDKMPEKEWRQKLEEGFDELYKLAHRYGGMPSGEHGVGWAKKKYLLESLGERQIELMRGIKRVFDPNGIMNPGKVF